MIDTLRIITPQGHVVYEEGVYLHDDEGDPVVPDEFMDLVDFETLTYDDGWTIETIAPAMTATAESTEDTLRTTIIETVLWEQEGEVVFTVWRDGFKVGIAASLAEAEALVEDWEEERAYENECAAAEQAAERAAERYWEEGPHGPRPEPIDHRDLDAWLP